MRLIENKTKEPSEKLSYLGKYTEGEVNETISGLLPLYTKEAYTKATKFGRNTFLISDAYTETLFDCKTKIHPNIGPAFRKSCFFQLYQRKMNNIQYLTILKDSKENQRMLQKLSSSVKLKWQG